MKRKNTKKGFTLLELLVVVVIIGILAAIALPQYKLAVTKSKFAALKNLTKSLLDAEERFYMTNGNYTDYISNLDIDIGGEQTNYRARTFPWGICSINLYDVEHNKFYIACKNTNINMSYQIYPKNAANGAKECVYHGTDTSSAQYKVCQQETGKINPYGSAGEYFWYY